jgi:hypothetical protein
VPDFAEVLDPTFEVRLDELREVRAFRRLTALGGDLQG